ncbi:MAG: alpha/beta hydrolase [Actinomycetota bacterium]|nr:alpha/beta hydrolase [Actinomycetota bacterium]
MTARWFRFLAAFAGVTAAYRWERRRSERAVSEDPEWSELQREIHSTPVDVTSIDGTRLHAEVFGPNDAPTIILVHGWCCSLRFWHYQLKDLVHAFRIVAYDLRGHGRSDRSRTGDYSTDVLAADLDAVVRACVPPGEQVVVVGHSMGGMSIVAWAAAHPGEVPHRLAGVVLVDTGMSELIVRSRLGPRISGLSAIRTATGRLLLSIPLPLPAPPDPIVTRLVRYVALSNKARPAHVWFCTQMVVDCSPVVRAACGTTLARLDLTECLPSLTVPTVVLVGDDDVLTPPAQSQLIAASVPGSRLFHILSAGHMSPVEKHEEVTRHIRTIADRTLLGADP